MFYPLISQAGMIAPTRNAALMGVKPTSYSQINMVAFNDRGKRPRIIHVGYSIESVRRSRPSSEMITPFLAAGLISPSLRKSPITYPTTRTHF